MTKVDLAEEKTRHPWRSINEFQRHLILVSFYFLTQSASSAALPPAGFLSFRFVIVKKLTVRTYFVVERAGNFQKARLVGWI